MTTSLPGHGREVLIPAKRLVSRFLVPGPRRFISRFADRVLPVDLACQPKAESFRRPLARAPNELPSRGLAREVLTSHVGRQWRLLYDHFRGGWNTISKEDAFEACKEILGAERQSALASEARFVATTRWRSQKSPWCAACSRASWAWRWWTSMWTTCAWRMSKNM